LIDDNTADGAYQTWRVIGTAEGGGGSWVGTATSDLDMGGFDIINIDDIKMAVGDKYFFDGGTDTYMTGSSTSGRINIFNNSVNVTSFLTSGLLTTNITCSGITTTGDIDMNQNEVQDCGPIKFGSTSALTGTDVGWSGLTGDIYGNVQSGDSYFFRVAGTTEVEINADGIDIRNGWLELEERSAPSGLSNHARLYAKDNGAGKTQLVVIFGSGAEQVIATEP